jgi:hypothetical protein
VECDTAPGRARGELEALLGPATVVVASGGTYHNPVSGELEQKLHLHWRLATPTRDDCRHALLKEARRLAANRVGADPTNTPLVHPIRWPGSIHRKAAPRLAQIIASDAEREIDLEHAVDILRPSQPAQTAPLRAGRGPRAIAGGIQTPRIAGSTRTDDLVQTTLSGTSYHSPLASLAIRLVRGGTDQTTATEVLRGLMLSVPPDTRDMKDGVAQPGRWQVRFDNIPNLVASAAAKLLTEADAADWPEPIDFLSDAGIAAPSKIGSSHLPDALLPFVEDSAQRMGADVDAIALAAVVALSAVAHESWQLQPKQRDNTWTEGARLWGAIVGDPGIMKTPVIKAATAPLDRLDAEARRRHTEAMRAFEAEVAASKAKKGEPAHDIARPRLERFLVENATIEAMTEVLRDDGGHYSAPSGKVLVRQDEMSEWLANMDRYKSGGRGGGDRGAFLRAYNGGRYVVDRVQRGSFAVPNWSACVLGGIQPEPIQRIAQEAADDGLLQRFCFAVPREQGRGVDRAPDHAAIARYNALFPMLLALRPRRALDGDVPPVVLHENARQHAEAIFDLADAMMAWPDQSVRLRACFAKWRGLFARLTLLFHLIEIADARAHGQDGPYPGVAGEQAAARAAKYMRTILLPHLLRADAVMFDSVQHGHAQWIARFILARGFERITVRDIMRSYAALKAPERRSELCSVMRSLETMEWVRAEPTPPGTLPSSWVVNPVVHRLFVQQGEIERQRREQTRQAIASAVAARRTSSSGEQDIS